MLYTKATREVASCARCEDLSFTLPFDPLGAPWPCCAHPMTSRVEIFDVEYVDDTMWAVRAKTPTELNAKLDRLITLVVTCFRKYRLSLNFGLGKTECMIQYTGHGALAARDSLHQSVSDDRRDATSWPFFEIITWMCSEVVCDYKLVVFFCDGDRWPDARSCSPHQSFSEFLVLSQT